MTRSHRRRLLGLVFVIALLGVGVFAVGSNSAFGDTTNSDGSHTATATIPPVISCPTAFNGTVSVSPGLVVDIPANAINITHQLLFGCPGSAVSETYNDNASSPAPSPGDRTVRDDFSATCNQGGGCAGGTVGAELDVTYFDPAPNPLFQPGPPSSAGCFDFGATSGRKVALTIDDLITAKTTHVGTINTKTGFAVLVLVTGDPADLHVEGFCTNPHFQNFDLTVFESTEHQILVPRAADAAKRKRVRVATFADGTLPAGQSTMSLQGHLTAIGRKLLSAAGKLPVTLTGTVSNLAGSVTISDKMKLIAKK